MQFLQHSLLHLSWDQSGWVEVEACQATCEPCAAEAVCSEQESCGFQWWLYDFGWIWEAMILPEPIREAACMRKGIYGMKTNEV